MAAAAAAAPPAIAALAFPSGAFAEADAAGDTPASGDLTRMSLTEIANIEVSSVSKANEALQRAPASIYVITHEDISRSAATNFRSAGARAKPAGYANHIEQLRDFRARAGREPERAEFFHQLLILIDGRSVYTPLFSGIYANTLDVKLEDVDRIEVISGVGATLWGANAMNGVINTITRASYLTKGLILERRRGQSRASAERALWR